jgi:hypothetical protein
MRDHGGTEPARHAVRLDRPFEDGAGAPGRQHRAEHEPAILRLVATVEQLHFGGRADRHAACRVLGCEHEAAALGDRSRFGTGTLGATARRVALRRLDHGIGRIDRERTTDAVRHEAVVEIGGGKEFEIEPGIAGERGGHGLVEDHRDGDRAAALFRADAVLPFIVGIFERDGDRAGRGIDLAIDEAPDRVPLAGCRGKTDVAIGGDPFALLNDLYAADLRVGEQTVIPVGKDQHVGSRRLVIPCSIERQVGRRGARVCLSDHGCGAREQGCDQAECGFGRHGFSSPV